MRDIVADILSVSSAQMGRMESINEHLNEGFKAEFASGNIGISTAYDASTLPEAKQAEALDALRTGKTDAVRSAVRAARDRKLAGTVKHYDAPEPEDLQPIVPEPAPSMPVVPSPEHRRSILDGVLNDQRTAEAKRLARQLRKAATGIPFDAVCDDAGDEVNIRAACLSAARLLEAFAGQ
jgi:hypothetical protein